MPTRYEWTEMLVVRLMELNSMMPHYYSELFLLANQLLEGEDNVQLHLMIEQIERLCLSVDERKKGLVFYDVEMMIESSQDYSAYFEHDNGKRVYKLDVDRELSKIKVFIFDKVKEIGSQRRFSKFI
jgi:hypothetical protein